jgi:hypothetical protein
MKFFCELYDFSYNYIKRYSFVMRYLNELILKGGVKRVSLLLAISIDSDHIFFFFFYFFFIFFFYACRCISRVGLEESRGYS